MPDDRAGNGWGELTFHDPNAQPATARGGGRRRWLMAGGGVAAALALGLAAGFWARPHLAPPDAPAAPMKPVSPTMAIQVAQPAEPGQAADPGGKLAVLSPAQARAAPVPIARTVPQASEPPAPVSQAQSDPPPAPGLRDVPRYGPAGSFQAADTGPCSGDEGRAAQMVCEDPELAAADRELARVYRQALRAGVPPERLRDGQRQWLAVREDAAARSPRALARAYDRRIDEIEDLAESGPGF